MSKSNNFLIIKSKSSGAELASNCAHANSAFARLIGLLNHSTLENGTGLLLDPCNQVHTFFMRFPIDAVFLNRDNKVIAIRELQPWKMTKMYFKAKKTLELPLGTCRRLGVHVGELLEVTPC